MGQSSTSRDHAEGVPWVCYLILSKALTRYIYYHSHFTDGKVEAQMS